MHSFLYVKMFLGGSLIVSYCIVFEVQNKKQVQRPCIQTPQDAGTARQRLPVRTVWPLCQATIIHPSLCHSYLLWLK